MVIVDDVVHDNSLVTHFSLDHKKRSKSTFLHHTTPQQQHLMRSSSLLASVGVIGVFWTPLLRVCRASGVTCQNTFECETSLMEGSECVDGFCTNPFYNGGCLKHMIPTWHKVRVCNSRDPPSAMRKGFCRPSPLDFMEIRINSNNWESAFFSAWILTVILSEILDVPVSIETGFVDLNVDFYDAKSSFDYGVGYGWDALRTGANVGDCRKVKHDNPDEYIPCAHFMPELWAPDYADARVAENEGAIESPADLGALGFCRSCTISGCSVLSVPPAGWWQ